nr:hypothetical protein CFP56_40115 [Quercus suber]
MSSDTKARVTILENILGVPAEGEQLSVCDKLNALSAETTVIQNQIADQRDVVLIRVKKLAAALDAQGNAAKETQNQLETKISLLKKLELKRQAVRDLPSAMSAANALVDYKFNKPNGDDEKRKLKDKVKDKQKKDGKKNKAKQKKIWVNKSKGESSTSQQSKE